MHVRILYGDNSAAQFAMKNILWFNTELAVLTTINAIIKDGGELTLSADDVLAFSRKTAKATSYVVFNRFNKRALTSFFLDHFHIFARTSQTTPNGLPIFRIRTNILPAEDTPALGSDAEKERLLDFLCDYFAPATNYPLDFLRAIGALEMLLLPE